MPAKSVHEGLAVWFVRQSIRVEGIISRSRGGHENGHLNAKDWHRHFGYDYMYVASHRT